MKYAPILSIQNKISNQNHFLGLQIKNAATPSVFLLEIIVKALLLRNIVFLMMQ